MKFKWLNASKILVFGGPKNHRTPVRLSSTANTTYYVRAYVTNSQGIAYGSEVSFKTSPTLALATVTTTAVTTFSSTTAVLGGNVANEGNATVTERGVVYATTQNPTTSNTKVVIGNGSGSFSNTIPGLTANTTYYVRAYAINSQGIAYGDEITFITLKLSGTFTDSRDGNTYEFITIGSQTWMTKNLAYLPSVSPPAVGSTITKYYYVHGYNGTNVLAAMPTPNYLTYGVLYNWPAALTACPSGWHIPSDEEWGQLEINLGMTLEQVEKNGWRGTDQGAQMKNTNGWDDNGDGTNTSGFSTLPGSFRYSTGTFGIIGNYGHFWSSTEDGSPSAWGRGLASNYITIARSSDDKSYGFSVRCIRD